MELEPTTETVFNPTVFNPTKRALSERCVQVRNLVNDNDYDAATRIIELYKLSDNNYFRSPGFLIYLSNMIANSERYSLRHIKFYLKTINNLNTHFIIRCLMHLNAETKIVLNMINLFKLDFYEIYYNATAENNDTLLCQAIQTYRTDVIELFLPDAHNYSESLYQLVAGAYLNAIQISTGVETETIKLINIGYYIVEYFPKAFTVSQIQIGPKLFANICSVGRPRAKLVIALLEMLEYENLQVEQIHICRLFQHYCGSESLANVKRFYSHYPDLDITADDYCALRNACSYGYLEIGHLEIVQWLCELNPDCSYRVENRKIIPVIPIKFPFTELENCEDDCPICYVNKSDIKTNCNHNFCKDCIRTYYRTRMEMNEIPKCPCCRTKM